VQWGSNLIVFESRRKLERLEEVKVVTSGSFSDPFWVEDLKGADTGYYTTVQLSGDMDGPGASTIPAANVFMSVAST